MSSVPDGGRCLATHESHAAPPAPHPVSTLGTMPPAATAAGAAPQMPSAAVAERALAFDCRGERLVGVVSLPAGRSAADTALVVVVGGPQVRTGSHRQFTRLCREAAAAGVPALRFDVRGMGDASGALRAFDAIDDDIAAAIDALQRAVPAVRRVVLWGLCDGASAALLYVDARRDARVAAVALLNPWVRSAATLARTHVRHYYWHRLRQPGFWRKLLRGGVAFAALRDLVAAVRTARGGGDRAAASPATFQQRMLAGAEAFAGPMLWVLSGRDYTAREFVELLAHEPRWQAVACRRGVERLDVAAADHTFSTRADEDAVVAATLRWLATEAPVAAR